MKPEAINEGSTSHQSLFLTYLSQTKYFNSLNELLLLVNICSTCKGIYICLNTGGSHNLDLNLGMAAPGHEPKENKGYRQFQTVPS